MQYSKTVSLNDNMLNLYLSSDSQNPTPKNSYKFTKNDILNYTLQNELTEKQKKCFILYYAKGKKMSEIAHIMNVNVSTVSRHIKAVRKKVKDVRGLFSYGKLM